VIPDKSHTPPGGDFQENDKSSSTKAPAGDANRLEKIADTKQLMVRHADAIVGLDPLTGEAFGRDVVWSHPAYSQNTAFVRNDKELVSVRLAE